MTKKDFVARGSAWIQRAPEDGKDGVGITSADVVFAQSKSNTNPPSDADVWKTNVKELPLVDGYLWSGTKIVYSNSNGKSVITGKYCIGSTRDYTDIEELYYLSDSGDKIPTNVTFQPGFKPEKGKYLWTCIRYRFKAPSGSAENTNWVYSTPTCAGYFGDDGVSIQSSDVVFAISESKTTAPTTGWITNFGGLTLAEGKYVWTCTKTTLTDGDSYYTGAYCLGECYDFAQVEELYALGSSATKSPDIDSSLGVNIWQSSYTPKKGMYLWTCVRVTYNSNTPPYYLNKKCVSYFPTDGTNGTKFTPKGTAYGHYTASSKMPKPSDDVLGLLYLVDKVDTTLKPINSPCVAWWRSISAGSYILAYDAAEEGDAYNVDGTLWVHNGTVWKDFGSIQGPKGDDGEDALNIELLTEKILFDYYEGNFDPQNQAITLVVRQGGNVIKSSEYNVKIVSSQNFDIDADYLTIEKQDGSCTLNCYANGVNTYTYTYNDGVSYVTYPASSCSIKISVEYNGITYFKELSIEVSFVKMYGGLYYDTEHLSSTYGELVGEGGRLSAIETNITQNAENIKLTATRTDGLEKQYSEIKVSYNSISAKVASTEKGLLDTGINITKKTIKMTANNFTLYNNKEEETFSADEYGNGVFKGTITATGGSFGSLQMTSYTDSTGFEFYGMHAHTAGTTMIASSTYTLDYQGLYVGTGLQNNGGSVYIGHYPSKNGTITNGVFDWENGVINVEADNSGVSNADISGIGVKVVGNSSNSAIGMKVSATGGKNNYAVDAENGDIRVQKGAFLGVHRGNVRKVTSSTTLLATDSTIICNNTASDIVVTLPSDLAIGTFFRIIKKGKTVTFRSGSKNISLVNNKDLLSEVSSTTAREWIHCIWDGDSWLVEMSRS